MGTFAQIKAKVEVAVIDLPATVLAAVPGLVNDALREIQNRHNFKVMEAAGSTLTTTVATRVLSTVPSDFKEFRGEPYTTPYTGKTQPLIVAASRQHALSLFAPDDDGFPVCLLASEPTSDAGAANIEVWPLPDGNSDWANGEYRITTPYYRFLPALSADGDTNWFTVNAENWLVFKATAEGFALDWDTERQAEYLQKAEREYGLIVNVDKRQRLGGVTTLVVHKGARGSRPVR